MVYHFLHEKALLDQTYQPELLPLDRVAVIILGGGEGKRLHPLTITKCKPAVSFGGRYTLIDIPISHALLTGLSKIYVIGQYMANSLHRHLSKTYPALMQRDLHFLVPEERGGSYEGTADAIRKNLEFISELAVEYFLVLSGDQLYNINFQKMIQFGIETDASMVIASQLVDEKNARRMGLMKLEPRSTRLREFTEKPNKKELLEHFQLDDLALARLGCERKNGKDYLGSMGIYLFKRQALFDLLLEDSRADFGKHLIVSEMGRGNVHSYLYNGYWEDIGTIESYYYANLALTKKRNGDSFDCYDEKNLIMTQSYHLPGAKVSNCLINDAVFCEGSIIEAAEVTNSIIGVRSQVGKDAVIRNAILVGNSYYERPQLVSGEEGHSPTIGEGSMIHNAIIDENVKLGQNVRLINREGLHFYDHPEGLLFVRDGIIIVPAKTHLPDNFVF